MPAEKVSKLSRLTDVEAEPNVEATNELPEEWREERVFRTAADANRHALDLDVDDAKSIASAATSRPPALPNQLKRQDPPPPARTAVFSHQHS